MTKLNPKKIIYIAFGVLVIAYIIFKNCLELWGTYTVCKIRSVNTAGGGTSISYEFYYKDKKIYGNINAPFSKANEGHYYFVKFWELIPRVNLLQADYPADPCASQYKNVVLDKIPECKE
jgi:hypothetical protein